MSDEYPGVKRLIVHFTDPGEVDFDWPFVALEREIASIEVDGEEWVPKERIEKLADMNGYLCAEVNRLQKLVEERTCCIEGSYYDELIDEYAERIEHVIATTLGRGTGEWVLEHSGTLYDKWRCSKCGYL